MPKKECLKWVAGAGKVNFWGLVFFGSLAVFCLGQQPNVRIQTTRAEGTSAEARRSRTMTASSLALRSISVALRITDSLRRKQRGRGILEWKNQEEVVEEVDVFGWATYSADNFKELLSKSFWSWK